MINMKLCNSKFVNFMHSVNQTFFQMQSAKLKISGDFHHIYGFGEKYNSIDHIGNVIENKVSDQFCNQNEKTYFPVPFFFMDNGVGVYIETRRVFIINLEGQIEIDCTPLEDDFTLYVFTGTPKEMIMDFLALSGETPLPPKWAFGPWMSGHRWNTQSLVEEALQNSTKHLLPFTSLVIEQWSDEATFYIFNDAKYTPKEESLKYEDFFFEKNAKWPNPKQMIENIHNQGIKFILWQAPMIKELEPHEPKNLQSKLDQQQVVKLDLICRKNDGSIYRIPKGRWFPGSMIPDFSNPMMKEWWFSKRKYLLDIGVDGFKTDGGEFVYDDDLIFHSTLLGKDMVNQYSKDYIQAYHEFIGDTRVTFSRAGYIGQQSVSIQWAGDQKSTWKEFKSVYNAGINASLCGQTFWGFDIGGFAGELPSLELYIRSTQFAVFTPIMQFHSEPVGGQFALIEASKVMNNERSPWNILEQNQRMDLMPLFQSLYWMRMNLLPYIYSESIQAIQNHTTLMKHLMIDYSTDELVYKEHNGYLLGNILIVPILEEGVQDTSVYFPKGRWTHLITGKTYVGGTKHNVHTSLYEINAFVKDGNGIILNLNDKREFPGFVGNDISQYKKLTAFLYGDQGSLNFIDEESNCTINWENKEITVSGKCCTEFEFQFK